jgi:YesN/AraC family two-component response regulator
MAKKILYVDDEAINLQLFELNFQNLFDLKTAKSGKDGIDIALNENIPVVISDLKMPGMNGIEMIKQIKKEAPDTVCILLSAYFESEAVKMGITDQLIFKYITKPWRRNEVLSVLNEAFREVK